MPDPAPDIGDDGTPWCAPSCRLRRYEHRGTSCRATGDAVGVGALCRPVVVGMREELVRLRAEAKGG